MKIKVVCERTGLTDRTIRYYIEEGLLSPSFKENYIGRKAFDFTEDDISKLNDIAVLRSFDFSIEEIRQILKDPSSSPSIIKAVKERVSGELTTNQKKESLLSSLQEQTAYTVCDLAKQLSTPAEITSGEKKNKSKRTLRMAIVSVTGLLLFIGVLIFVFAFCNKTCEHRDADDNALCDLCEEAFSDAVEHAIGFKTLVVNDTTAHVKVSNSITSFSFFDEVGVLGNAAFEVYRDLECKELIESNVSELAIGDNIFYVLEYVGGERRNLYTVTVRRKPMYTVTFDTEGGTAITSQLVEEDAFITVPDIPDKQDYFFAGWSSDLTLPVTGDITIKANWTGKPYTVTFNANGGTVVATSLVVTYGQSYMLQVPERIGYSFEGWFCGENKIEMTGICEFTENITLIAKWKLSSYTVTFTTNGGEGIATQALKYGAALPNATRAGYTFGGWFSDVDLTTAVTTVPGQNAVVYAWWVEENKPYDFSYSGTHEILVTDFKNGGANTVCIPAFIGGKPVTRVDDSVFRYRSNLVSITFPVTVTDISSAAFQQCSNLASIIVTEGNAAYHSKGNCLIETATNTLVLGCKNSIIPDYVTSIGDYAFAYCSSLTSITIPAGVTSIGNSAFYSTDLKSIILPDTLTSIGSSVFANCISLTSITLPSGLKNIPNSAFYRCDFLTSITIPAGVTSIGNSAFYSTDLRSIILPDTLTSIGSSAFANCISLTSITLPNGLKSIPDFAFSYCYSLTSITIPTSVTSIGYSAFYASDLRSVTLPFGVTSIGKYAFGNCIDLVSITIPNSVTNIGMFAFYCCYDLASITIPTSVTNIGQDAFGGCHSLTSLTIPLGYLPECIECFSSLSNRYFCCLYEYDGTGKPAGLPSFEKTQQFGGWYADAALTTPLDFDAWLAGERVVGDTLTLYTKISES